MEKGKELLITFVDLASTAAVAIAGAYVITCGIMSIISSF